MEKVKQRFEKIKTALKKFERLRLRKMHLDYLAGLLTLPVLLTAIILNLNNLNRSATPAKDTASPSPQVIIIPVTAAPLAPTTPSVCQKSVGPVTITYPQEGQTVSDNPVCVLINYSNQNYCSVIWSYSINNGSWSDNNNAPCLYNLPNGNIQFQLRVSSTVSNDTQTFTRNFIYTGANNPVITPTPTLTVTLTQTQTPTPTLTVTPVPTSPSASSSAQ